MLKNITLSAEDGLLRKAREKARREKTTLNATFREWLKRYVGVGSKTLSYDKLMQDLNYARPGRRFSRDELNER